MNKFARIKKIILWTVIGLLSFIGVFLIVLFLLYPPEFVIRSLKPLGGDATAYDYKIFPERQLKASPNLFSFPKQLNETGIRLLFESIPKIKDLDTFLTDTGTQAFIVIKDDVLLYEKYFNETQRDSIVTSFSVAKSIASALIGIAIHEGFIKSVNDPITNYLPELSKRDVRFSNITIRHLLLMSSGMRYQEEGAFFWKDDGNLTYRYPNLRELAIKNTEIIESPGEHFLYNCYHPLLLGLILERTTGKTVTDYLQEKIWNPLGMEFGGSWSLDSESSGFEKMESGINARAIDFAKIGRLFLNQGNWNGIQVIPAEWVNESTQPDKAMKLSDTDYYAYMWWGIRRNPSGYDFFALGNLGQIIYVSPDKNLIIVRHGEKYGLEGEGFEWAKIFYQIASKGLSINKYSN
ncbi:MAG: serine hydrolase [Candidatus Atribacteria bacterium]|nr:serine hydrolase [Candidatus Atribacteria bacterium]